MNPNLTLPHPTNCAQFYNCSMPGRSHRDECKYPTLFNQTTRRCEMFNSVDCGDKTEPQAPCKLKYHSAHGDLVQ